MTLTSTRESGMRQWEKARADSMKEVAHGLSTPKLMITSPFRIDRLKKTGGALKRLEASMVLPGVLMMARLIAQSHSSGLWGRSQLKGSTTTKWWTQTTRTTPSFTPVTQVYSVFTTQRTHGSSQEHRSQAQVTKRHGRISWNHTATMSQQCTRVLREVTALTRSKWTELL